MPTEMISQWLRYKDGFGLSDLIVGLTDIGYRIHSDSRRVYWDGCGSIFYFRICCATG
jgi:hypothetical protein